MLVIFLSLYFCKAPNLWGQSWRKPYLEYITSEEKDKVDLIFTSSIVTNTGKDFFETLVCGSPLKVLSSANPRALTAVASCSLTERCGVSSGPEGHYRSPVCIHMKELPALQMAQPCLNHLLEAVLSLCNDLTRSEMRPEVTWREYVDSGYLAMAILKNHTQEQTTC